MATKIRLARHGRKQRAFYHIVVADSKAPRDGNFIEKIGTYNPVHQPAIIELDVDKAVAWLNNGAQPTDTAKAILKYKGAIYKRHLLRGVKLGVVKEEEVEAKFNEFVEGRLAATQGKYDEVAEAAAKAKAEAEAKAKAVAEAKAAQEAAAKAEAEAAEAEETLTEEAPEEETPEVEASTEEETKEESAE